MTNVTERLLKAHTEALNHLGEVIPMIAGKLENLEAGHLRLAEFTAERVRENVALKLIIIAMLSHIPDPAAIQRVTALAARLCDYMNIDLDEVAMELDGIGDAAAELRGK